MAGLARSIARSTERLDLREKAHARVRKELERRTPFARSVLSDKSFPWGDVRGDDGRVYAVNGDERHEILADAYADGVHYRPWASKKEQSLKLASMYERYSEIDTDNAATWQTRAHNVANCGRTLLFGEYEDDGVTKTNLLHAFMCHDPFCPVCLWRRSIKNTMIMQQTLDLAIDKADAAGTPLRFLHVVLTVPNCALDELKATVAEMHASFNRMRQESWWKATVVGFVRATEITLSKNPAMVRSGRVAHPHMHLLIAVSDRYFSDRPPVWHRLLRNVLYEAGYSPRQSMARCATVARAACRLRDAVARGILSDAARAGVTPDNGPMWRTKYRKLYQRIVAHLAELDHSSVAAFTDAVCDVIGVLWLNQREWLRRWQRATGNDEIKGVHVSPVKHKLGQPVRQKKTIALRAAVKELGKYMLKDGDLLCAGPTDCPDDVARRVGVLREQISGLRRLAYGGLLKELHAEVLDRLKTSDDADAVEDADTNGDESNLINLRETHARNYTGFVVGRWNGHVRAYIVNRVPMCRDAVDLIESLFPGGCPDWLAHMIEKRCSGGKGGLAA